MKSIPNYALQAEIEDTSFKLLMRKRINNVLLVCNEYDAFILEEDGRIDEQVFNEYVSLNLRYPPQFFHAFTAEEAKEKIVAAAIDLVIIIPGFETADFHAVACDIKEINEQIPIVVLSSSSKTLQDIVDKHNSDSPFSYVFYWLGNMDILLAIIKLIEDKMNVDHDVFEVGLQAILLVEDSVKYYSMYLPLMYKLIFTQSKAFMSEGLNEHQKMLRLRGRPKILLATDYEEAIYQYEKYKSHLLGIISDVKFKKDGEPDPEAGIQLCRKIKSFDPRFPFILQSSDAKYKKVAEELKAGFVHKESDNVPQALKVYFKENFAFGDFIFRDPVTGKEIDRANDLQSLQQKIFQVDEKSFEHHIKNNDLSKWLNARALFPISNIFRYLTVDHFPDLDSAKRFIYDTISNYRLNKLRGMIAEYDSSSFDEYFVFSRIGKGSIGGKARGLAFIDSLMKKYNLVNKFENTIIAIPRTVVLSTEIFDEFMTTNKLDEIDFSGLSDDEIIKHFINASFPVRVHEDMLTFVSVIKKPIAIRSSSLLEDSLNQPFAGIYSTYMLPYSSDERKMMFHLCYAIKCVYASVYFKASRSYMSATSNLINEEKMAIILQEVCGKAYDDLYFPSISGVARSINYYPIGNEKPEDGIANIAIGLGRYIMSGGMGLRFSPEYPKNILQLSSVENTVKETQKEFNGLYLDLNKFEPSIDDGINIASRRIKSAPKSVLKHVASFYDVNNERIVDGMQDSGIPLVTFSNILNHGSFPLAEILKLLLKIGQKAINNPVEIEFAVDLDTPAGAPKVFNFLQIRPIVESKESYDFDFDQFSNNEVLISSEQVLGNGVINDIKDIVYVKPESFNSLKSYEISRTLEKVNDELISQNRKYVLVGPGRWGSVDPNLGIPVKWYQISGAKVIIESGLENYRIEPSQGTHFFHNLTALEIAYFTVNPFIDEGTYDVDFLKQQKADFEDEFVRHVRFENTLRIQVNARKNRGIILKPAAK